jgi:hypothetical protein
MCSKMDNTEQNESLRIKGKKKMEAHQHLFTRKTKSHLHKNDIKPNDI